MHLFGCRHTDVTKMSFLDLDGNKCHIAFCCHCGVLRYYRRVAADKPGCPHRSGMQPNVDIFNRRIPEKHIEQYPEPEYAKPEFTVFGD